MVAVVERLAQRRSDSAAHRVGNQPASLQCRSAVQCSARVRRPVPHRSLPVISPRSWTTHAVCRRLSPLSSLLCSALLTAPPADWRLAGKGPNRLSCRGKGSALWHTLCSRRCTHRQVQRGAAIHDGKQLQTNEQTAGVTAAQPERLQATRLDDAAQRAAPPNVRPSVPSPLSPPHALARARAHTHTPA